MQIEVEKKPKIKVPPFLKNDMMALYFFTYKLFQLVFHKP